MVYSATKHIDGQGRVLGGVILASEKFIMDHVHQVIRQTGPSLSPFNAWVMLKGLETLAVRVERQTANAAKVADALAGHAKIARLIYPGRADHPQAAIIKKQMSGGSNLISFEIKGGKEGAFRFLNGLKLIGITNNLGDAKSLITHPTTTTHQRLTPAAARRARHRRRAGAPVGRARARRRSDRGFVGGAGEGVRPAPDAAQHKRQRSDAPPIRGLSKVWVCYGPGSAAQHGVPRCARDTQALYGLSGISAGATLADSTGRVAASAIAPASPLAMQA